MSFLNLDNVSLFYVLDWSRPCYRRCDEGKQRDTRSVHRERVMVKLRMGNAAVGIVKVDQEYRELNECMYVVLREDTQENKNNLPPNVYAG